MEGLICSLVGIQHPRRCIPLLRVIIVRSALHHLRNAVLKVPVQAFPEFHDDGQAIGVAGLLNQLRELVDVIIHRLPALVVPCDSSLVRATVASFFRQNLEMKSNSNPFQETKAGRVFDASLRRMRFA